MEDILAVANDIGAGKFRPSIDPASIPAHPFDPAAPEQSAAIPITIGFTKDEQTLYIVGTPNWPETTEADVLAAAERNAPGKGKVIVDAFMAQFPDYAPHYLLMQVTGTYRSLSSHHTLATRRAVQGSPVFAYVVAHDLPPQDFVLKAPHAAEIPYIMDNVANAPLFAGATPDDVAMGKLMSATWVQFACTGDPNGAEGLPVWPKFEAGKRLTMFFSRTSSVVEQPCAPVWKVIRDTPNPKATPI